MTRTVSFAPATDSLSKPLRSKWNQANTRTSLKDTRRELRHNMHHRITVLPHRQFMDFFVPIVATASIEPPRANIFKTLRPFKNEKQMYHNIPVRLNRSKTKPCVGYTIVATQKRDTESGFSLAPDCQCGFYPDEHAPQVKSGERYGHGTDWVHIEIPVKCERDPKVDPFDKDEPSSERTSEGRKSCLDQVLSDSELLFLNQNRMFHFHILFLGHYVRILRIDCSGIFVTEQFHYQDHEEMLTEFLRRYSQLSPEQRGHDTTVERIDPEGPLAQQMCDKLANAKAQLKTAAGPEHAGAASENSRQAHSDAGRPSEDDNGDGGGEPAHEEPIDCNYVLDFFEASLDKNRPWWKIQVHDELTGTVKYFVAGKPHFQAPGVCGRGTRGHVALPLNDDGKTLGDDFVYLKDAWRVKHPAIQKEGTTLKFLNDKNVRHVPTLLCHGDLPSQLTQSPVRWKELNPGKHCPLKEHQHYRIVVKEVGASLSRFEDSSQLVTVLYHCVRAHESAFKVGIIHRDISSGNILLYYNPETKKWEGILTDWELSKDVTTDNCVRQPERTGTWQFMSVHIQDKPGRVVVVADELESIFHVLIFFAIRFLHHNLQDKEVGRFLHDYFDACYINSREQRSGLAKRMAIRLGEISLSSYIKKSEKDELLQFALPSNGKPIHPLNDIIETLSSWFQAHYAFDKGPRPLRQHVEPREANKPEWKVVCVSDDDDDEDEEYDSKNNAPESREGLQPQDAKPNQVNPQPSPSSNPSPSHSVSNHINSQPAGSSLSSDPSPSRPVSEETKNLAKNLYTHRPMVHLLRNALNNRSWPARDKLPDKRPKKLVAGADCDPSGSWQPPDNFAQDADIAGYVVPPEVPDEPEEEDPQEEGPESEDEMDDGEEQAEDAEEDAMAMDADSEAHSSAGSSTGGGFRYALRALPSRSDPVRSSHSGRKRIREDDDDEEEPSTPPKRSRC